MSIEVIHWDCLDVMKWMKDNSIDLVLTDPPYKFEVHWRGIASKRKYMREWFSDIGSSDDYDIYNSIFLDECIRLCKKPNIFVFCNKSQLLDIFTKSKELWLNWELIVFCKKTPTPLTNNQWLPDKEYGVHLFKWMTVYWNYDTKRSFFLSDSFKNTAIWHPTAKPVYILEKILNNLSEKWHKVLDCFAWSGSTGIACKRQQRDCILIEKEKKYIDIINKRLANTTVSLFH